MIKILLIGIFIMIPFVSPENLTDAELKVVIETDQNLNTELVGFVEGDMNTDIYCNAQGDCTTNLYGGEVTTEGNISLNQYISNEYVNKRSGGLSFGDILNKMVGSFQRYMDDGCKSYNNDACKLWSLLDMAFVSHKEYKPTFNNVMYLADEVDKLKAENMLLKKHLGVQVPTDDLECLAGIFKSERTNDKVITDNGWIIDINKYGRSCIKVE